MAKDDEHHYGLDEYIYLETSKDVPPHKYAINRAIAKRFDEKGYKKHGMNTVYRRVDELASQGKLEEADQGDPFAHPLRGKGYRITEQGRADGDDIAKDYLKLLNESEGLFEDPME